MDASARECIDRDIERLAEVKPCQPEVGNVEACLQRRQIGQRECGAARRGECPDFGAPFQQDGIKGRTQFRVAKRDLGLTHLRFSVSRRLFAATVPALAASTAAFATSSFALLASYAGLVMLSCSQSADTREKSSCACAMLACA